MSRSDREKLPPSAGPIDADLAVDPQTFDAVRRFGGAISAPRAIAEELVRRCEAGAPVWLRLLEESASRLTGRFVVLELDRRGSFPEELILRPIQWANHDGGGYSPPEPPPLELDR